MIPDEGRYAEISREMSVTNNYVTPYLNGIKYLEKPPLFYWMESFVIKNFGISEASLRLVPMFLGVIGCLVTYMATRQLYGRRSALLASFILSSSGLYYTVSHMVILDVLFTLYLSCSLFCFILSTRESVGRAQSRYMYGIYIFAALATLSKGLIAVLLLCLIIFSWVLTLNEWSQLKYYRLLKSSFIFLILVSPWYLIVQFKNPEFLHSYFNQEHLEKYLTNYTTHAEPLWFFTLTLLLGFFPWICFLVQSCLFSLPKTWQDRKNYKESIFLMLWVLIIILFFSFSQSKLISYIAPLFPALAILVGRYFNYLWEKRQQHSKGLIIGFILILMMGLGLSLSGFALLETHSLSLKVIEGIHYLYISYILLISITLVSVWLYTFSHIRIAFISLCILTASFLVSLNFSYSVLNPGSTKSLALTVKPLLKNRDQIFVYHAYYQDLPVYLENKVTIVDWKDESTPNINYPKNRDEGIILDEEFYMLWQDTTKQRYMVMNQNEYPTLREKSLPLYLIAETPRYVLVTNMSTRE